MCKDLGQLRESELRYWAPDNWASSYLRCQRLKGQDNISSGPRPLGGSIFVSSYSRFTFQGEGSIPSTMGQTSILWLEAGEYFDSQSSREEQGVYTVTREDQLDNFPNAKIRGWPLHRGSSYGIREYTDDVFWIKGVIPSSQMHPI